MRTTPEELTRMKGKRPIVMLTAYDAWMARLLDAKVDCLLVGDSLGGVIQGREGTREVTLTHMVYHTSMVARGTERVLVISDLPHQTYDSVDDALHSARRCIDEGQAQAVKLEGGRPIVAQVEAMMTEGIPVAGHLGWTPQTMDAPDAAIEAEPLVAGEEQEPDSDPPESASNLLQDALALEEAGIFLLVLSGVHTETARTVTASLGIPTIGIGSGPHCDGQVQVSHDLLGLAPPFAGEHALRYLDGAAVLEEAVARFAADVRAGALP